MRKELKLVRVENDLTQAQMAKKLGIALSTYNLIENGKRGGNKELWIKLKNTFNVSDERMWKISIGE